MHRCRKETSMNPFTERVIQIIQSIPAGRVMTYGQVAAAAGNRRGARQVARILHTMSQKHALPWHRIINAKGEISFTENHQRAHLEAEGITFGLTGKVDLPLYRWFPSDLHSEEE